MSPSDVSEVAQQSNFRSSRLRVAPRERRAARSLETSRFQGRALTAPVGPADAKWDGSAQPSVVRGSYGEIARPPSVGARKSSKREGTAVDSSGRITREAILAAAVQAIGRGRQHWGAVSA